MDAVARRGPRGGATRDARCARARIHVVHIGWRRAVCARPGRTRARDAHLGGRPAPPRAYHGARLDRRPASIQPPRRPQKEKPFFSARAAAKPASNRRRDGPAVRLRRARQPPKSSAGAGPLKRCSLKSLHAMVPILSEARPWRAIVPLPAREEVTPNIPVPLPARARKMGVRG